MLFKQKTTTTSAIMAAVLALALSGTSHAAGSDILKSNIPQIYGKSKDVFQGNDQKTIIQIQDAHGNVESQENIQAILKTLSDQGKIDAVMDEGGWNEYDLSSFDKFSQDDKQFLMDWYTKFGLTHGATRYKVLDNSKMPVIGSEDKAAYMDGLKAFREAGANKKESLAAIEKIKGAMEAIKLKLFDEDTRNFLQATEDFKKDQITLTSFATALKKQAEKAGVNFASYNNFSKVVESIALEEKIDFAKIDRERLDMVDELETKVDKKVADEIVTQSLNYRLGKVAASEYYNFLLGKASGAKLDMSKYGNVTQYSSLVNLYASINDDALFAETDRLEGEIKSKLFKDKNQVEFDAHLKNLDVLNKLIGLQMTRTDLAFWKENKDKISAAKTVAFLKDQAKALNLGVELQDSLGQIDQKLASNERFYEIALKRDDVMVEKTLAMMDEKGFKTVVLVAGGFHSEGIAKALKAKAISHMIVTPRITNPDAENFWMQNMMGDKTEATQQLEKAGINANVFTQAAPDSAPNGNSGTKETLLANLKALQAGADTAEGKASIDAGFKALLDGPGTTTTAASELSAAERTNIEAINKLFADQGFTKVDYRAVEGQENSLFFGLSNGVKAPSLRHGTDSISLPRAILNLSFEHATLLAGLLAQSEKAEVAAGAEANTFITNLEKNSAKLHVLLAVLEKSANLPAELLASKIDMVNRIFDDSGNLKAEAIKALGLPTNEDLAAFRQEASKEVFVSAIDNIAGFISSELDTIAFDFLADVKQAPVTDNAISAVVIDANQVSDPAAGVAANDKYGQNFRGLGDVARTFVAPGVSQGDDKLRVIKRKIALENGIPVAQVDARIVGLDAASVTKADYQAALKAGQHVILLGDAKEIQTALESTLGQAGKVHYLIQEGLDNRISNAFAGKPVIDYDVVRGINFAQGRSQQILAGQIEAAVAAVMKETNKPESEVLAAIKAFADGKAKTLALYDLVTPLTAALNIWQKANNATAWMA